MEELSQLITDCKAHRPKAQHALYEAYAGKMMSLVLRYVGDRESAKDILQEAFVKLFNSIASYSGEGSFEGWMRRVFVNTALEHLRRNDVLRMSLDIEEYERELAPDYSALEQISANELMELVMELAPGFRAVFCMFAIEGYSHKEIAEALGTTESTSRSQYTRAKKILQKRIAAL